MAQHWGRTHHKKLSKPQDFSLTLRLSSEGLKNWDQPEPGWMQLWSETKQSSLVTSCLLSTWPIPELYLQLKSQQDHLLVGEKHSQRCHP